MSILVQAVEASEPQPGAVNVGLSRSTSLNDLTKQQTALETRMDSLQLSLMAKYNAMDTLVAQITASATSMMTTLNSLNNPKST